MKNNFTDLVESIFVIIGRSPIRTQTIGLHMRESLVSERPSCER